MKHIIYSNYDLSDRYEETKQLIIEDYPELCNEVEYADGTIIMEPSDEKVWDFIYDDDDIIWRETFAEVKKFFEGRQVIMFGSIGRWDGTFGGGEIGDFEDLFYDLIEDCDYIELSDEDGHFYIRCSHHDGSNSMEVKILSQKGYDFADNWKADWDDKYNFPERELHRRLATNNFLSSLPHYWKKVWA